MPEFTVVLSRVLAVASLSSVLALPAAAAEPPEEFGGIFWGSMLAMSGFPDEPMPRPFVQGLRRDRGPAMPPGPDGGMPGPPMLRGIDLTEAQQDKVFSKFFRADNIVAKQTEGTGLGLYLVYALMKMLGGSIAFQSRENIGTTFSLTLPLSPPTHE